MANPNPPLENLNPQVAGQPGNPGAGRPKGSRSLATIIRELNENPPDWELMPKAAELAERYKNKSAWEAIVYVAMEQALKGDQQAREFLAKRGYGDKIDFTSGGEPVKALVEFVGASTRDTPDKD